MMIRHPARVEAASATLKIDLSVELCLLKANVSSFSLLFNLFNSKKSRFVAFPVASFRGGSSNKQRENCFTFFPFFNVICEMARISCVKEVARDMELNKEMVVRMPNENLSFNS